VSRPARENVNASVALLIAGMSVIATAAVAGASPTLASLVGDHPLQLAEFLLLTLVLQLFSVQVYGGGRIGVSAVGLLATGIALGPGPAMAVALVAALVQWIRSRGLLYRAVFDAAMFCLDAGAGAIVYKGLTSLENAIWMQIVASFAAGLTLAALNNGLLCLAIGLDEGVSPLAVWRERFRWARFHYLSFGPLAYAAVRGYEAIGIAGLVAFTLPPGLLLLSVHQYVERTKEALEHERAAKAALAVRNEDLHELYRLTIGLAKHGHDQGALVAFAERELTRILRADAVLIAAPGEPGIELRGGDEVLGALRFVEGDDFDGERWERLRETIVPQLAAAVDKAGLVGRVWKTHLETIAALSRSMEAKDYYTGGHTERVAQIAVGLARRLGVPERDIDALEIGALMHDIGKIGIPERILNKPEALDAEEWAIMKEHPVISDHILSEVELPPLVRQVARSSHERIDGTGYPDGLAGDEIPLAARIVLVADAFDALTSDRTYRRARHTLSAMQEIRANSGTQFCPRVVEALERLFHDDPLALGSPLRSVEPLGVA
jgi:HD-GYP domain-containing protein (c-di-GMP phosphodiesterase class II)